MEIISFQQNTGFKTGALIKRNQPIVTEHDNIRSAVRAWAAAAGQDVVSGQQAGFWYTRQMVLLLCDHCLRTREYLISTQ